MLRAYSLEQPTCTLPKRVIFQRYDVNCMSVFEFAQSLTTRYSDSSVDVALCSILYAIPIDTVTLLSPGRIAELGCNPRIRCTLLFHQTCLFTAILIGRLREEEIVRWILLARSFLDDAPDRIGVVLAVPAAWYLDARVDTDLWHIRLEFSADTITLGSPFQLLELWCDPSVGVTSLLRFTSRFTLAFAVGLVEVEIVGWVLCSRSCGDDTAHNVGVTARLPAARNLDTGVDTGFRYIGSTTCAGAVTLSCPVWFIEL